MVIGSIATPMVRGNRPYCHGDHFVATGYCYGRRFVAAGLIATGGVSLQYVLLPRKAFHCYKVIATKYVLWQIDPIATNIVHGI